MLGAGHVCDQYDRLQALPVLEAGTAKVVLVPKDSRGPRLISCEPLNYQWIQQGLGRKLMSYLESHPYTRGHVNFVDQTINQRLALQASADRNWVTLDMKEASDRVSLHLVRTLFDGLPILEALEATRTPETKLPDGRLVRMNKFAPMGSALCFPIESFVFYALCVGVLQAYGCYPCRDARSRVFVYGDDLVVRREDYAMIMQHLPAVGLLFNSGKCCTEGFFRESCGVDAYLGFNVTPVKIRTVWSLKCKRTPDELSSYIAYANVFDDRSYYATSEFIRDVVTRRYGKIPTLPKGAHGLVFTQRYGDDLKKEGFKTRFCKKYHRLEVYGYISRPVKRFKRFDARRELFRRLLKPEEEPIIGMRALPKRSVLRRGWFPVN